jgi:hypothetical protein
MTTFLSRSCHAKRHALVTLNVTLKHCDVTAFVTPLVTGMSRRCHMTSTPPIYLQVYLQPLGELYSRSFGSNSIHRQGRNCARVSNGWMAKMSEKGTKPCR